MQIDVSSESPTQSAPIPTGAGSSQSRVLVLIPVSQVLEQIDQELQDPQLPSTINRKTAHQSI